MKELTSLSKVESRRDTECCRWYARGGDNAGCSSMRMDDLGQRQRKKLSGCSKAGGQQEFQGEGSGKQRALSQENIGCSYSRVSGIQRYAEAGSEISARQRPVSLQECRVVAESRREILTKTNESAPCIGSDLASISCAKQQENEKFRENVRGANKSVELKGADQAVSNAGEISEDAVVVELRKRWNTNRKASVSEPTSIGSSQDRKSLFRWSFWKKRSKSQSCLLTNNGASENSEAMAVEAKRSRPVNADFDASPSMMPLESDVAGAQGSGDGKKETSSADSSPQHPDPSQTEDESVTTTTTIESRNVDRSSPTGSGTTLAFYLICDGEKLL